MMYEAMARPMVVKLLAVLGLCGSGALGCMSDDGAAAREFEAGMSTARAGLTMVRDGVALIETGADSDGLVRVEVGLGYVDQGVEQMHSGVQMMADGDTAGCCEGMADHRMMGSIDGAMAMMGEGYAEMTDGDISNDDAASAHVRAGMDSMEAGLADADGLTSCGDMMGR
jgi:hypothetical protein